MLENNSQPPKIRVSDQPLTTGFHNRTQVQRLPKRWIWPIVGGIIALVALIAIILFIRSQKQLNDVRKSLETVQAPENQMRELVEKVGKFMILPTNEEPTIATVSDLAKLQGQPFFAKAQLGDKVLIYKQDKKAILYRPSTNQLIEVAPLNNSTDATGTTP